MTPNQCRRARRGRVAVLWGGRRRSRACMRLRFAGREPNGHWRAGGRKRGLVSSEGQSAWRVVPSMDAAAALLLAVASSAMLWCLTRLSVVGRS
jgi:hypothetical protein